MRRWELAAFVVAQLSHKHGVEKHIIKKIGVPLRSELRLQL